MVEISLQELKRLRRRDIKLSFLEMGGVDNWQGYGMSLNNTFGDKTYNQTIEEMEDNLKQQE